MNAEKILDNFSSHLKNVIARAIAVAAGLEHYEVAPLHLLFAVSQEEGSTGADLLFHFNFAAEPMLEWLEAMPKTGAGRRRLRGPITKTLPALSASSKKVLERAMLLAFQHGHRHVGTEHLLHGLAQPDDPEIMAVGAELDVDLPALSKELENILQNAGRLPDLEEEVKKTLKHLHRPAKPPTALSVFTINLTDQERARQADPVIGRGKEIDRLIQILARRTKNNPILVGEAGVGKTAIVEGLAKLIATGAVPEILRRKQILALDLPLLISGAIYRGEFEARLKQIIDEVAANGDLILFIDELHNIIGAGTNGGTMDAANILKPALARGQLRCIGATTADEYAKYITNDSALERRFQTITVNEPSGDQARAILHGLKPRYEQFHRVTITDEAIAAAVEFSTRYLRDNFLPDKAIDLMDEAAAAIRSARAGQPKTNQPLERVERRHVAAIVGQRLDMPVEYLLQDEWERLKYLHAQLAEQIIGQAPVIARVTQALRQAHLRLGAARRPFASFLFVGPSGVGKTELATVLARALYRDEESLIRLDMSEFSEAHGVSKLLGSPAGYIGYKERNRFTDTLRRRPYSVVLFDEFDKAHADVQKLLLQILDTGELTDSHGKKIHFNQAIVILTASIGAELYRSAGIGFGSAAALGRGVEPKTERLIRERVKELLGADLLSRIQDTCIFAPLTSAHVQAIVRRRIEALSQQLQTAKQFQIVPDAKAVKSLAGRAYTNDTGVRQIDHVIQQVIHELLTDILQKERRKKQYTLTQTANAYKLM